jgi:hypothetical protein
VTLFHAADAQKKEAKATAIIKGTVVAEYNSLAACGWHVCGLALIVRLDKRGSTEYVVVNVAYMDQRSLPQNGKPLELVQSAKRWKFITTVDSQRPLDQYWSITDNGKDVSTEVKAPAWSLLNGAKDEVLPFGVLVRHFSVDVGNFKKID